MSSLSREQLSAFDTSTTLLRPAGSSSPWVSSFLRRVLDFSVAAFALLFCGPLFVIVAIAVRISSPGPALIRQQRKGVNGRPFTMYKFRSMLVGSERGSTITVNGDARITGVGAFLRRYKLDELPQFWNVVKGDMSLVGPRPKLPQHEGHKLPWRPGITGPATLKFRDEEELLSSVPRQQLEGYYETLIKPAKVLIDFEYMQRATFISDCTILLKTLPACLSPGRTTEKPENRAICLAPENESE
jgi:lipopolysaccharide/colanic/teichoic acid biosynthesis glycosyltransferase